MDEKMKNDLMAVISGAMTETNAKWDQYWAQVNAKEAEISQLQADIKAKEAEIAQLRADYEKENAARILAEEGLTEANSAKEAAEASLAEANAKIAQLEGESAKAELNAALAPYSEEQRQSPRMRSRLSMPAPAVWRSTPSWAKSAPRWCVFPVRHIPQKSTPQVRLTCLE